MGHLEANPIGVDDDDNGVRGLIAIDLLGKAPTGGIQTPEYQCADFNEKEFYCVPENECDHDGIIITDGGEYVENNAERGSDLLPFCPSGEREVAEDDLVRKAKCPP